MDAGRQAEGLFVRSWITEGIFIALITASAYFWALRYEEGWYQHFQIPLHLISLNLTNVLSVSGALNFVFANFIMPVLLLLWIWNPTNRFAYRLSKSYPTAWFFLSTLIFALMLVYLAANNVQTSSVWFWMIISFPVLFYAVYFTMPLISKKGVGRYWDRFRAEIRPLHRGEPSDIHFSPSLINVLVLLGIFAWIWFGTYFSYFGGKRAPNSRRYFP
jgi:hypothetical protein